MRICRLQKVSGIRLSLHQSNVTNIKTHCSTIFQKTIKNSILDWSSWLQLTGNKCCTSQVFDDRRYRISIMTYVWLIQVHEPEIQFCGLIHDSHEGSRWLLISICQLITVVSYCKLISTALWLAAVSRPRCCSKAIDKLFYGDKPAFVADVVASPYRIYSFYNGSSRYHRRTPNHVTGLPPHPTRCNQAGRCTSGKAQYVDTNHTDDDELLPDRRPAWQIGWRHRRHLRRLKTGKQKNSRLCYSYGVSRDHSGVSCNRKENLKQQSFMAFSIGIRLSSVYIKSACYQDDNVGLYLNQSVPLDDVSARAQFSSRTKALQSMHEFCSKDTTFVTDG